MSYTPLQFVVRLILAMAVGFSLWLMSMLLVAWAKFRE
jgi:hypothetical protein